MSRNAFLVCLFFGLLLWGVLTALCLASYYNVPQMSFIGLVYSAMLSVVLTFFAWVYVYGERFWLSIILQSLLCLYIVYQGMDQAAPLVYPMFFMSAAACVVRCWLENRK